MHYALQSEVKYVKYERETIWAIAYLICSVFNCSSTKNSTLFEFMLTKFTGWPKISRTAKPAYLDNDILTRVGFSVCVLI